MRRVRISNEGSDLTDLVTATALPQYSRRNVTDKDGQVTTKTLITSTRRDDASRNPKSANLKAKTENMVELFEAAKKAADLANVKGILLGKIDASHSVEALSLLMRINITPNPKEPGRMMERLEGLTRHKDRNICNAASALLQQWSQRIIEQERKNNHSKVLPKTRKVTTKTLITSLRRDDASGNPKSAVLKAKTEKMVELFEAAKKAADLANTKGILLGKTEASRCVEGLSLLMRINITPNPKEPRQMMKRLEGLTKHKDRKICNAASALLQLWRQRIVGQERKDFDSKKFPKIHKT